MRVRVRVLLALFRDKESTPLNHSGNGIFQLHFRITAALLDYNPHKGATKK